VYLRKNSYLIVLLIIIILFSFIGNGSNILFAKKIKPNDKKEIKNKKEINKKTEKKQKILHYNITITATRTKKDIFNIAKPVSVISKKKIDKKAPNNVTELLTELPGVDINGVGANQSRPVIRGFRGQRILLLEDGMRMNNSRQQQNFGALPASVDIGIVERVEVVRGPASVLYGSDAIGGVINIITSDSNNIICKNKIYGNIGYRYSTMDRQNKEFLKLGGSYGKINFSINGNYRKAESYIAPSGSFGDVQLKQDTIVNDTGVNDYGIGFNFNYKISKQSNLLFKYKVYNAKNAGFGFVEPEQYNPGAPKIRIQYPLKKINKYVLKYENNKLNYVFADRMSLTGYITNNNRELNMDIFVPFGIPQNPKAGASVVSNNHTDITTYGFRYEFNKLIKNNTFTYGIDFYNDNSINTDLKISKVLGFGPPHPRIDNTPQVPNASYISYGFFLQDEISLFSKLSVILGLRYQNVIAKTKVTSGLEDLNLFLSKDNTLVGSANILYSINDNLRLFFSVGRGFRSPNIIERFFNGITPAGRAFQSRNLNLKAESSLNFDIGVKYRLNKLYFESTYFNNIINDGIRIDATGNKIAGMPEYRNINIDKLRMYGFEVFSKYYLKYGFSLTFNYTSMKSDNVGNPETPYTDTYSSKLNFSLGYEHPKKIFWLEYHLRINGNQKDVVLGKNPIGDILPGFSVHSINGGITLFKKSAFPQRLGFIFGNITNTLYAEFSNASFFRPAPKRYIVLTWSSKF